MKKNLDIIKVAELGKAGASVFSKLAIDGDPSPKPKPKPVVLDKKPVIKVKPAFNMAKHDSIAKENMKKDPVFKATIDSMNAKHKSDSLKVDADFKKEMRQFHVADSLQNAANREAFVQDSTNYGSIIARIKRAVGL